MSPLHSPERDPADRDITVFLGPDPYGVALEVGCVELPDGDLLVIHAMKVRDKYREDLDWEMRCRSL